MIMLTEEEFAIHVNGYCQCGCTEPLIAHDREQRAEIELLSDIIRRAAWLEQAPEEGSPYIDFESYARATEESEALRARAEKAEAELARYDCSAADARICKQQMIEQRSRADRYLAAIKEYVQATDAEKKAEEAYAFFGSRMMDRSLPPVTEADVNAAFTTVATARDRAYASTVAIRTIVEEARRAE